MWVLCVPAVDPLANMFALIRTGVRLKPVSLESPPVSLTDSHQQLLLNALAKINRVTQEAFSDANSSDADDEFEDWVKGEKPVKYKLHLDILVA